MENDKIIFYLNDKLNLYYHMQLEISKPMQGTNYNNKARLTFFQFERPHLKYSC